MTSSPGPISSASRTSTSASVPFATPTVAGTPRYAAASSSKAWTFGPRMKVPESSTSAMRLLISSSRGAYCARTSTSGVCGTASQSTRPPPADYQPDSDCDDARDDGIVEVVVEALPVATDDPADAGERQAPGGRADEGQHRVTAQGHPEHPG